MGKAVYLKPCGIPHADVDRGSTGLSNSLGDAECGLIDRTPRHCQHSCRGDGEPRTPAYFWLAIPAKYSPYCIRVENSKDAVQKYPPCYSCGRRRGV